METLAAVRKPCFAVWITAPTFATVIGWNTTVEKSAEKIEAPTGAGFKLETVNFAFLSLSRGKESKAKEKDTQACW